MQKEKINLIQGKFDLLINQLKEVDQTASQRYFRVS